MFIPTTLSWDPAWQRGSWGRRRPRKGDRRQPYLPSGRCTFTINADSSTEFGTKGEVRRSISRMLMPREGCASGPSRLPSSDWVSESFDAAMGHADGVEQRPSTPARPRGGGEIRPGSRWCRDGHNPLLAWRGPQCPATRAPPKAKLSSVDLRRWPTRARCRKQLDGEIESLRACGAAGVLTALPRSCPDGEGEEQQRCAEGEEGDGLMDVCCFEAKPHARFGPRHLTSRCVPRAIDTRATSRRGGQDRCSTFSNSSSKLVACRTIPCSYVPDPVSWSVPRSWATSSAELRLLERDAQRSMPSKVPRISRSFPTRFPLIITALAWALCSMAIASPVTNQHHRLLRAWRKLAEPIQDRRAEAVALCSDPRASSTASSLFTHETSFCRVAAVARHPRSDRPHAKPFVPTRG